MIQEPVQSAAVFWEQELFGWNGWLSPQRLLLGGDVKGSRDSRLRWFSSAGVEGEQV
jgi:hypothetical protein